MGVISFKLSMWLYNNSMMIANFESRRGFEGYMRVVAYRIRCQAVPFSCHPSTYPGHSLASLQRLDKINCPHNEWALQADYNNKVIQSS